MATERFMRLERRLEEDAELASSIFTARSPWEKEAARQVYIHVEAARAAAKSLRERAEDGKPQITPMDIPDGMSRPEGPRGAQRLLEVSP